MKILFIHSDPDKSEFYNDYLSDLLLNGFRENYGGIHLKYNINPDIAIFGKTLGNGFAINAILGKSKIMNTAKRTFISSTFWTERIGFVAANKTLEIFDKIKPVSSPFNSKKINDYK